MLPIVQPVAISLNQSCDYFVKASKKFLVNKNDHFVGEASVNLTTLYGIVTKLSLELEETKKKLDIAEEKLEANEKKLNIGNVECSQNWYFKTFCGNS